MSAVPGSLEDLSESVNALTRIVERVEPMLEHMAEALAAYEQDRANLRGELAAARARTDELAECCLYLVEATQTARMGEARARAELEHLRELVDEEKLRQDARDAQTPARGYRVPSGSWSDE